MQKSSIELKIQSLLKSGSSNDFIVEHLEKGYKWPRLSETDLSSLCRFFINSGYSGKLVQGLQTQFLADTEADLSLFPWKHFAEALFKAVDPIPGELVTALIKGATELGKIDDLAQCQNLDAFDSKMETIRNTRKANLRFELLVLRDEYNQQLELLRTQGLLEDEVKLLQKCIRLFPNETEYPELLKACRERMAAEAISRRPPRKSRSRYILRVDKNQTEMLANIVSAQKTLLKTEPELGKDFIISQIMFENYSGGRELLQELPIAAQQESAFQWLKIELLLRDSHYIELVEELNKLERLHTTDPEATWAIAYYKTQALWGLGEKYLAIDALERLVARQPDYRSAATLLAEMKEDLE